MNQDNPSVTPMSLAVAPADALQSLRIWLKKTRVRLPVLVTGAPDQVLLQVEPWTKSGQEQWLWLSSRAPEGAWSMAPDKANHELGREADGVVVDLFDGWAVDAIAALAGVIRAGGLMVFMSPPLAEWAAFSDPQYARITVEPFGVSGVRRHFLARMARWFETDRRVVRVTATGVMAPELPALSPAADVPGDEWGCKTQEQRAAVDAILSLAAFARTPPLVVQADRGRGKSAALGIAAARLARQGLRIVVTSPRPEAAETLLQFAGGEGVEWHAPDALVQHLPAADVLLVDEAAALAPALLVTLLQHYSRAVLATTVQGYEGTGQGFNTRFARHLDQHHPGWRLLRLEQPVRWAAGDPLEAFINDVLLLNACDEPPLPAVAHSAELTLEDLTPQFETLTESRLRAVQGLLVAAHYRTRPSDLRTLLDGPNVRTFVATHQQHIVAVAMVAEEGNLPAPLAADILAGRRRPHGHVLAQSLAVHLNVEDALTARSWRIVRIAVHSGWQRRGVGRWFLQQLQQQASSAGISCLGSLFAASPEVLAFWQQSGFEAVRVGISREATSGAFPVLVIKGLQGQGIALADSARQRFEQTFLQGLADTPEPWPPALVVQAWQQGRFPPRVVLHSADIVDIHQFIASHKTYENAAVALACQLRIWMHAGLLRQLAPAQQQLLIGRLLQKRPWTELIAQGTYTGQKQVRAALRDAIATLERLQPACATEPCLSS